MAGVFREVQPTARFGDEFIEFIKDRSQGFIARRNICRQRPSRVREGQGSGVGRPESLQNGKEAGCTGVSQSRQCAFHNPSSLVGNNKLILQEALRSVHPIPIAHPIEWMEETRNRMDLIRSALRVFAEPRLIERTHGRRVQQAVRDESRSAWQGRCRVRERGIRLLARQLLTAGVITSGEHAPSRRCDAVDPRDRIPVVVIALDHASHHVVEVRAPHGVHAHTRRLDRKETERRFDDHSRQAHSTDSGPEHFFGRRVRGRQNQLLARPVDNTHRDNVTSETTFDVVVLAVNVGRDRPTDGDESSARRDGDEKTGRHDRSQNLVDARASICRHGAAIDIKFEPVQARHVENCGPTALCCVAVTATEASREHTPGTRVSDGCSNIVVRGW